MGAEEGGRDDVEDIAATTAALRARVEQANHVRMTTAYAKEQADQQLAAATAALKEQFGVETPEQARALAEDLDRQISAEAQAVEKALNGAGS